MFRVILTTKLSCVSVIDVNTKCEQIIIRKQPFQNKKNIVNFYLFISKTCNVSEPSAILYIYIEKKT